MTPKTEYGLAGQEGLHQDDKIVGDSVDPIYDALRSEDLVDTFQQCLAEAELDAESISGTCNSRGTFSPTDSTSHTTLTSNLV